MYNQSVKNDVIKDIKLKKKLCKAVGLKYHWIESFHALIQGSQYVAHILGCDYLVMFGPLNSVLSYDRLTTEERSLNFNI